jgi:hypothetical protein
MVMRILEMKCNHEIRQTTSEHFKLRNLIFPNTDTNLIRILLNFEKFGTLGGPQPSIQKSIHLKSLAFVTRFPHFVWN